MKLSIRRLKSSDMEIGGRIAMAAYERPHTLEPMLRFYAGLQPSGWFLASLDGEAVGLGGAIDYGTFAYLGMMSVLPSAQKRGVGQALMEAILTWLEERGCPTVLLNARSKAISLYRRCGFVQLEETLEMQALRTVPATEAEPLAAGVSLARAADLPELTALDAPAFGSTRQQVLAAYLATHPEGLLTKRNQDEKITGFILARPKGPALWYASRPQDAEPLLKCALSLCTDTTLKISLSGSNRPALELLKQYGFTLHDTLAHMQWGRPLERDPAKHIYGMASLMLG